MRCAGDAQIEVAVGDRCRAGLDTSQRPQPGSHQPPGDDHCHCDGSEAAEDQHGRELADECQRLLKGEWKPINCPLAAQSKTLQIPYAPAPTAEELQQLAKVRGAQVNNTHPAERQ